MTRTLERLFFVAALTLAVAACARDVTAPAKYRPHLDVDSTPIPCDSARAAQGLCVWDVNNPWG